jgi:hypothetical protein
MMCIGSFIGYYFGRYIDPDLDLISTSASESRLMEDFGIFGSIIVGYFVIYAYLMRFVGIGKKGHRNFYSHFPGVSTIIRLIWLLAPPTLVSWWFMDIPTELWVLYAGLFCGLLLADCIHFILDYVN